MRGLLYLEGSGGGSTPGQCHAQHIHFGRAEVAPGKTSAGCVVVGGSWEVNPGFVGPIVTCLEDAAPAQVHQ